MAWIQPREDAVEATIQCVLANSASDAPVDIKVRRDRSGDEPVDSTGHSIPTAAPLPCSALAEYLPLMASLGSDAEFSGTMRWQLGGNHWWVDLGGSTFEHVSLDRLFEQQAHRLSGTAKIQFDRCRIEPHNRRKRHCWIDSRERRHGRSLAVDVGPPTPGLWRAIARVVSAMLHYDRLALAFDLNNTKLKLIGICHQEFGSRLSDRRGALPGRSGVGADARQHHWTALKLVTAIAPPHSVLVPLSKQTSWLMNIFIPPSRPLPSDDQPYPPRIRRLENARGGPDNCPAIVGVQQPQRIVMPASKHRTAIR